MKKLLVLLTATAITWSLTGAAFAVKPAEPAKAAAKAVGEAKPIPMYSRADSIDTKARTFTMKRKDGVEVKHVITAATEIKQGDVPAKLEDIKVGEYVSGLRQKVSETEYTVIKITAFGPKKEKKASDAKPADKKPAEAKPAEKKTN